MFSILLLSLLIATEVFSEHNLLDQDYFEVNNISSIFEQFIDKYEKKYTPEEYNYRLSIFKERLIKLNDWNKETPGTYGVNEFSDLTFEEFSGMYLGFNGNLSSIQRDEFKIDAGFESPQNVDWRDLGVVTPVKNQKNCGSCYVFSAIGHIESRYAMKHKKHLFLSEQQALDCDIKDSGCGGGIPGNVFSSLEGQDNGVMLARDYPYVEAQSFCKTQKFKIVVKIKTHTVFEPLSEDELKDAVASYGPLSIAMLFTDRMRNIRSGKIYKPVDCEKRDSNHAVLLVGYGRDIDDDYWIIKNSWGTGFGDKGYMKMLRGFGVCNIGTYVAVAEVE